MLHDRYIQAAKNRIVESADSNSNLQRTLEQARWQLEESRRILGDHPRIVSLADLFAPPRSQRARRP